MGSNVLINLVLSIIIIQRPVRTVVLLILRIVVQSLYRIAGVFLFLLLLNLLLRLLLLNHLLVFVNDLVVNFKN